MVTNALFTEAEMRLMFRKVLRTPFQRNAYVTQEDGPWTII